MKFPLFLRARHLHVPCQFVARIKSINVKWRPSLQRPTVRHVFPSFCFFVLVLALILFFFTHPSGENDDNFLSHLPAEKFGVRPLCDSKDCST